MTQAEYWLAVQWYCLFTGGSVDSWGRTPEHSIAVGGKANDSHTVWMGSDVIYTGAGGTRFPRPMRVTEHEAETRALALGLVVFHEIDHDHIQPIGWIPVRP